MPTTCAFLASHWKLFCTLVVQLVSYWNKMFPKSCYMMIARDWLLPIVGDLRFCIIDPVFDPKNALEIRHQCYCARPRNDFYRLQLIVLPRFANVYVLEAAGNQHYNYSSTIKILLKIDCKTFASMDIIPGLLVFHVFLYIFLSLLLLFVFSGPR